METKMCLSWWPKMRCVEGMCLSLGYRYSRSFRGREREHAYVVMKGLELWVSRSVSGFGDGVELAGLL